MVGQDSSIRNRNKRLQHVKEALDKAVNGLVTAQTQAAKNPGSTKHSEAIKKRLVTKARAETKYQEAVEASAGAIGSGTGKVGLLLPTNYVTKP